MQNINDFLSIDSRNIKLTDANKDYITKKLIFLEKFSRHMEKIHVLVIDNKAEAKKLSYEITITTKKETIRVEEKGYDLYSVIDAAHDIVKLQIEKFKEKISEGKVHEKFSELEQTNDNADFENSQDDNFTNPVQQFYKPKITKRITYSDNRPMHPSEAIEQMEVLGHTSFLFKNLETNKYSMINKLREGKYALIEPETI